MRIVIKIGTSTLAHSSGRLNIRRTEKLCKVISDLKNASHDIILISSGAIGMGRAKIGLSEKPKDIPTKQAAAAVGQCELMYTYDRLFSMYNHTVAQILLTGDDTENEKRRENFHNTLTRLLELSVIPIINENDTIATEEIVIGDNDTLSAIVSVIAKADLLIDKNPRLHSDAKLISEVDNITDEILALAEGAGSDLGTGGMATKLTAAKIVTDAGIDMIIASGTAPEILYSIEDKKPFGTLFKAKKGI